MSARLRLAAAAPFAALVGLVVAFHPRVPLHDEWSMVALFRKADAGTLGLSDFWQAFFSDHRIVLPRLVLYAISRATHWDVRYEVAASVVVATATAALLLRLVRKQFGDNRGLATVAVMAVVFSPLAWENWLWGWQLAWFLTNFGLVLAVVALAEAPAHPARRFALAVTGALIATLSLAHGLLVWVVCAPLLATKAWRRWLVPWSALAVIVGALYLRGMTRGPTSGAESPVQYALAYITRPLTYRGHGALVVLVVLVAATAFVVLRRVPQAGPWLVLMGFAALTAGATTVGRAQLGVAQANTSRYTTVSGLLVLGLLVLLVRDRSRLAMGFAALLALGVGVNYLDGARAARQFHNEQLTVAEWCTRHATGPHDGCLIALHMNPALAWRVVQYARTHHLVGL